MKCLSVCTDELKQLISAADDCNVSFVYALSPGLDIVYTSSSDVSALKAKLDQVHCVKCMCCEVYNNDIFFRVKVPLKLGLDHK